MLENPSIGQKYGRKKRIEEAGRNHNVWQIIYTSAYTLSYITALDETSQHAYTMHADRHMCKRRLCSLITEVTQDLHMSVRH